MKQKNLLGQITSSRLLTYLVVLVISLVISFSIPYLLGFGKQDLLTEAIISILITPILAEWLIHLGRKRSSDL